MPKSAHFSPKLFQFLKDLRANNEREWFQAQKPRYEEHVKEPMLEFIADFSAPLRKVSPHFVADPRPTGGSMLRIYRDTRFSKDKTPYKTNAAAQFRHEAGKDIHAPGFYLHLEPGRVFVGAGLWRPDPKTAAKIREAIVEDPAGWKRAVHTKKFADVAELHGDSLKRPPRGVDPEHPLLEDLKRKDFMALVSFTQKQACSAGFADDVAGALRTMKPMTKFLTEAVDLPF